MVDDTLKLICKTYAPLCNYHYEPNADDFWILKIFFFENNPYGRAVSFDKEGKFVNIISDNFLDKSDGKPFI
ncbi:hypothetical protein Cylst_1737 [Cylindrospermum stagnale PCC 7417]|uniref:Uncharacterized protein n=1 Tax=Cylindrospermum stagnale PCC 7417 TaxID=56107 RepID=K9WUW5_9NOST|nr:hypothetical protein Cylst_1737 [Cylindrospermum stagnale PCC 7417]